MRDLIDEIVERLTSPGFDPRRAPWPHKVAVMLTTAQGLIDNGGFEYFLGNPFYAQTNIGDFPLVFDAVGATASAQAVREALNRASSIQPKYDDLNDVLWRHSPSNYALLNEYIEANKNAFV